MRAGERMLQSEVRPDFAQRVQFLCDCDTITTEIRENILKKQSTVDNS